MPSKTQEYLELANRTANGITRYWEHWTDYLTTASRLYKYSFTDQLMIYAQRPDATACASFDIWNNRMNRYVRRGSKGIALLDQSSSVPRLHYVFDVSDTGVRRNSRDPEMWQLNDDLFQPVSEMLAQEYGIHHERFSQQIADIAGKLAESYWDNNSTDILLFPARAACHKRAALATYRRIGGLIAIIPKDWKYLRGDIYYADMEPHIGSEQGGTRPVVVLQNDVGNRYAPTLIVATVTSRTEKKRYQPTHVLIAHNTAFEKPSVVQLEQIFTIDKSRIQRFLGHTTRREMRRIEEALLNSLEINEWDRRNADE